MNRARTVALVSASLLLLASSSSIATDVGVTYESNVAVKMREASPSVPTSIDPSRR